MALATMGRRSVFERGAGKGCLYGGWGEQGGLGSVVAMERWVLCECISVDGDGEAGSFDTLSKNRHTFFGKPGKWPRYGNLAVFAEWKQ